MIKIFPVPEDPPQARLQRLMKSRPELQIASDIDSCDVVLMYARRWNRTVAGRILSLLQPKDTPVVVLCEIAEEPFSSDSVNVERNISGVLTLAANDDQIDAALRAAAAGLKVQQRLHPVVAGEASVSLTARELQILRLIANGEGNKSIAYLLNISQHTVKFHISSIFEKLHVYNRTEAVKAGITRGLISV